MDLTSLIWIQNNFVFEQLNPFFIFITHFWSIGIFSILFIGILLFKKETRQTGIIMLAALILCIIFVTFMIKPLFDRPRPFAVYPIDLLIAIPHGSSFPSGHSSSIFAFSWAYFITQKNHWRWMLLGFATFVAFSRLYLFVHYPTDVVVGVIIGIIFAYISKWLIFKLSTQNFMMKILNY
jgi:undecaprenyl-diphosphatase